ncbi:hypothetical protein Tco_0623010 [Tanacetum coccineum]
MFLLLLIVGSDLDVLSPSEIEPRFTDPGICIEVESTRFITTHSPVIDTLLSFLSKNKDKVFNHGVLASKEKSPTSSSHRGFEASKLFHHKSPMVLLTKKADPRIFIRIQSKRFLSPDKFSISFIRDPPFPVINTLLPFSSKNEDKVVNPGILAAGEEKSPHLLSYRGFKAFQLISESPMMISRGDIPILDVPFLHFYPP